MTDSADPTAHSEGDRIVGKVGDSTVEGEWREMQRLAREILNEADNHKTDLQKIKEINGAHVRISCDCCDWEREFDSVRDVRDRGMTPEEHAEHPDFDCTIDDVTAEAFCPRHGTIPLSYDECDGCADVRNMMNR